MRLVETVATEGFDLIGNVLDDFAVVPSIHAAVDESLQLFPDQLGILLPHRLAENIRLGKRVAGHDIGNAHQLLLINNDTVGRLEHAFEIRMRVCDRLNAPLASDVDVVHAGVERSGAYQSVGCDEVVETVGGELAQHVRSERRFKLEYACRPAVTEHLVNLRIIQVQSVDIDRHTVPLLNHLAGVVDDRQGLQPEKVHLQHARVLERDHVVLRDDGRIVFPVGPTPLLRRRAYGHILVQGPRCDHHAGGVHRRMAR